MVFNEPTKKYVVLIGETDRSKIKRHALEYIDYGEKNPLGEPYPERPTCKARNQWWKLSPIVYPDMAFTMYFSSNFMFPKTGHLLDHTLYFSKMLEKYSSDITAIYSFLNSTLSYLYPDLYGRNYSGGAAGFMVYEVKKLLVPNPEIMSPYYSKLESIMGIMEKRKIGSVFDEIWNMTGEFDLSRVMPDRLDLDRTLLRAIGFKDPDRFLLSYYPRVVRLVRERLDRAKSEKTTNEKGTVSLSKVADEVIHKINVKDFPYDYVPSSVSTIKLGKGTKVSHGMDLKGP
ncbi:hypothetical protein [Caldiplasma sukawensis]